MSRLALLLALPALALAGCGGDAETVTETVTTTATTTVTTTAEPEAGDPADAVRAFVEEAARGEHGPEYSEGVGTFAGTDYEVLVNERIDEDSAVVAISGEREVEGTQEVGVWAAALELEDGGWQVETDTDPAMDIDGTAVVTEAETVRMWVDGEELAGLARADDRWEPQALEPGRHLLVAAAIEAGEVSALGWTS